MFVRTAHLIATSWWRQSTRLGLTDFAGGLGSESQAEPSWWADVAPYLQTNHGLRQGALTMFLARPQRHFWETQLEFLPAVACRGVALLPTKSGIGGGGGGGATQRFSTWRKSFHSVTLLRTYTTLV